ncbi:MAG: FAD-dependent oxidoreductase, partial [Pantoea piersonii]|uniref:FAD-binding protein n=2 Tax=Erwiniaceae TaxID=1903409 RepID=UPI002FEE20DC
MSRDVERYPLRNTTLSDQDESLWNWAQNARIGSRRQLHQPRSEAELQQLLRGTQGRVRVVGSRLSPGRMLDVGEDDVLVDISALSGLLAQDEQSVTVAAGTTLNDLYIRLTAMDRMLAASPGV